jgi:hypothetical protein
MIEENHLKKWNWNYCELLWTKADDTTQWVSCDERTNGLTCTCLLIMVGSGLGGCIRFGKSGGADWTPGVWGDGSSVCWGEGGYCNDKNTVS